MRICTYTPFGNPIKVLEPDAPDFINLKWSKSYGKFGLLTLHGPSDAWHRFLAIQRGAENFRQSLFARLPSNPQAPDIDH